jgi:hypothetical protein
MEKEAEEDAGHQAGGYQPLARARALRPARPDGTFTSTSTRARYEANVTVT